MFISTQGVLETSGEDFENGSDVFEAIGGVLNEVAIEKSEDEIRKLCDQLLNTLRPNLCNGVSSSKDERKVLDAPVHMGSLMTSRSSSALDEASSIWIQKVEDNLVSIFFNAEKHY